MQVTLRRALPFALVVVLAATLFTLVFSSAIGYADELEDATSANNAALEVYNADNADLDELTAQSISPQAYYKNVNRLSGANRYATMKYINYIGFESYKPRTVLVTTGENFPDALAAASFAGVFEEGSKCGAPIVLTSSKSLSAEARASIKASKPTNIYVIGGPAAVSNATFKELKGLAKNVERISGSSRVETSLKVYEKGAGKWGNTAIVATSKNFADALSISSYGYRYKYPVFLVDGSLTSSQQSALKNFKRVIICGGNSAVSASVEKKLGTLVKDVKRLAGSDRYATSAAIAKFALADTYEMGRPYMFNITAGIASGENFPDALAGAPFSGRTGSALLLVSENNYSHATKFIKANKLPHVWVFGGESAVSNRVASKLNAACV